jgi:DNA polymerase-3 subunit alpha
MKDQFLFVKGKVQARYNDANQLEVKVTSIQLLAEVREKLSKTFRFDVEAGNLNNDFVRKIVTLIKKHPGSINLKIRILDTTEKMFVEMPSLKLRVNPTNNFIFELKELTGMDYRIN